MTWIACELHTHTFHSDGRQSLDELALGAKALGFDCIALTDHSTMAGLAHKEQFEREPLLLIIPAREWTTYFGHMVTLGVMDYRYWRWMVLRTDHAAVARCAERGGSRVV
ncbi:histidinol phosphatase, partial [Paenibacillus riograndensis]